MHIKLEQGLRSCQIITDTYDNDLVSIQAMLHFMGQQTNRLARILVIASLEERGQPAHVVYHQLAEMLRSIRVDKIIGIGNIWREYAANLKDIELFIYKNVEELYNSRLLTTIEQAVIAIKHTPNQNLLPLTQQLYARFHNTVLEVNLDAIRHNLQFFRNKLAPGTKALAMVKALSYGSSHYEVAQLLAYENMDYLAVAYTDEGIALRMHGINLPIMVMSPMPDSFEQLIAYQLEPVLYSLDIIQSLQTFLLKKSVSIDVHIEVETGMHRLGFCEQDLQPLIQVLKSTPGMRPCSIMTQLVASGTVQHDEYTHTQARLFQQYAKQVETALGRSLIKHLLNTIGILRFPEYQFDMVRLGIGLYGVGIDLALQKELQPASNLKTTITQVKQVSIGKTVGYERKGAILQSKKIAILSIGYADGLSRSFGNGRGHVLIHGQLAPIIGYVCMDMVMVDITSIEAHPGDEAIIFGPLHPIASVAASIDTIPYELLTQVGQRVRRIYYTS